MATSLFVSRSRCASLSGENYREGQGPRYPRFMVYVVILKIPSWSMLDRGLKKPAGHRTNLCQPKFGTIFQPMLSWFGDSNI